jgi:hypothetical protein
LDDILDFSFDGFVFAFCPIMLRNLVRKTSFVSTRRFFSSIRNFELPEHAKTFLNLTFEESKPLLERKQSYLVKKAIVWPDTFAEKKNVLEVLQRAIDEKMDRDYVDHDEIWMKTEYDKEWFIHLLKTWGCKAKSKQIGNDAHEDALVISLLNKDSEIRILQE